MERCAGMAVARLVPGEILREPTTESHVLMGAAERSTLGVR